MPACRCATRSPRPSGRGRPRARRRRHLRRLPLRRRRRRAGAARTAPSARVLVCGSGAGVVGRGVRSCPASARRPFTTTTPRTSASSHDDLQRAVPRRARHRVRRSPPSSCEAFAAAEFSGEERHVRRLGQIAALERDGSTPTCDPEPRSPDEHRPRDERRSAALTELGTSAWLDRSAARCSTGGELQRLVDEDGVRRRDVEPGDLREGDPRQPRLRRAARGARRTTATTCRRSTRTLAIADVQGAADVLRPCLRRAPAAPTATSRSRSHPGSPATPRARSRWRATTGRASTGPNVMIKIPGTPEGVAAIEQAIDDGININVTLLFSLERRARSPRRARRPRGPRRRAASRSTSPPSPRSSSRASTARSTSAWRSSAAPSCAGKAAVANARAAYAALAARSSAASASPRCRRAGARPQRPLWASTGDKDPRYPDTSSTSPSWSGRRRSTRCRCATLLAYRTAASRSTAQLPAPTRPRHEAIAAVEAAGVSMDEVTDELLETGIVAFANAMDTLLAGIERAPRRRARRRAGEHRGDA